MEALETEAGPKVEQLSPRKSDRPEESRDCCSCSWRCLCYFLFFVLLIGVTIGPNVVDLEMIDKSESTEKEFEDFLKHVPDREQQINTTVYGASIIEETGKQNPKKNCVVFYNDDPEVNSEVVSTKICPAEKDNHVIFHMKGIFGTHPSGRSSGEPLVLSHISTGTYVWTSFFDQHNSTFRTFSVPPGVNTDINYMTNGAIEDFHDHVDAVKITHSQYFARATRGLQPVFPYCANFYETNNIEKNTKGFMLCKGPEHGSEMLFSFHHLAAMKLNLQNADTNGVSQVVTGKYVTAVVYTGKNFDFEELEIGPGSSASLIDKKRKGEANEIVNWNKKTKSIKLVFKSVVKGTIDAKSKPIKHSGKTLSKDDTESNVEIESDLKNTEEVE